MERSVPNGDIDRPRSRVTEDTNKKPTVRPKETWERKHGKAPRLFCLYRLESLRDESEKRKLKVTRINRSYKRLKKIQFPRENQLEYSSN